MKKTVNPEMKARIAALRGIPEREATIQLSPKKRFTPQQIKDLLE
jgi:hypothetical protein